ncbi:hypothetical protein CVV38_00505 [Candidatus Peregrinibacteria bacterium HGW-Peregrinibacteria-1]|jgi:hypothetical protein|nr:MAG: hypothetical protein CVV38_00505 [Candidatus Peregrinibacteria bacterium HGW-Peregrinibacteria-1]
MLPNSPENTPDQQSQPDLPQALALDEKWFYRFQELDKFQPNGYLEGEKTHRQEQKDKFTAGEIQNPNFDYPKINPEHLDKTEQLLLQLKTEIIDQEPNEIIKQVYRWKINEKIAELRLLRATLQNNTRWFNRWSKFIYGQPSSEIFQYTLQNLITTATTDLASENSAIASAANELVQALPQPPDSTPVILKLPSPDDITTVKEQTLKEMKEILDLPFISETKEYNAQEIQEAFQQALTNLRAEGWQAVIDTNSIRSAIRINQATKQLIIPESKKVKFDKLRRLVAHEIGTHIARRIHGEHGLTEDKPSKLKLLALGLDRYDRGEEGVATIREQALGKEAIDDFTGQIPHLGISLAQGLDGTPRDFRSVYTIIQKYFYYKELKDGSLPEAALETSQTKAYNHTTRIFRGTNCSTPGVCFTRDIVYREGNIAVWHLINQNTQEIERFSIGKYDPSNTRHIWILNQLEITDQHLKETP